MKIRLEEVAAEAGVSKATASRVLNGKPGVSEHTRQQVTAALELLGYARRAKPGRPRNGLIGLIIPELDNPVFPLFAQAVEGALAAHGYTPLLCSATPDVVEGEYLDMLVERDVAGIVFISGVHANSEGDHSRYYELLANGIPVVFVNGFVSGLDAPFISTNDIEAMRMTVDHLRSLGHTRIGCAMGPARYVPSQRKVTGFRRAMQAGLHRPGRRSGTKFDEDLIVHSVYSVEGGQAAAETLLDREVTAVVSGSDLMALGAIRAARGRRLKVPGDVSVVGYDDSPMLAFTDPPLTTVRQNAAAISVHAVNALLDEIRGTPQPHREILIHPELIVRGSTGSAPVRLRAATTSVRGR